MKTLWNAVSFLAVVHLLTLLIFVAWLWRTDRLDAQRVEALRELLGTTTAEVQAEAERQQQEAAVAQAQQAEDARRLAPPLPSAERVRTLTHTQHADERSIRRINDVKQQLHREIALAERQIAEQRAALDAQRESVTGGAAADRQRRSADQLKKAVKLLESLPPKQAKLNIVDLVQSGRKEQAVAYLNAMNQRAAGKILGQFKTPDESKLATELLERIRTLGLPAGEAGTAGAGSDASNAVNPSNTG